MANKFSWELTFISSLISCWICIIVSDICFSFSDDLNSLTSANIQRLPGSPSQNGTNSILKFYAQLTSGRVIPKTILATIFVERREKIFSLDSSLEDFTESFTSDETVLTPEQQNNTVPIAIINFLLSKVSVTSLKLNLSDV